MAKELYIQEHKDMVNKIWEGELAGAEALLQDLAEPPQLWLHKEGEGTWDGNLKFMGPLYHSS